MNMWLQFLLTLQNCKDEKWLSGLNMRNKHLTLFHQSQYSYDVFFSVILFIWVLHLLHCDIQGVNTTTFNNKWNSFVMKAISSQGRSQCYDIITMWSCECWISSFIINYNFNFINFIVNCLPTSFLYMFL